MMKFFFAFLVVILQGCATSQNTSDEVDPTDLTPDPVLTPAAPQSSRASKKSQNDGCLENRMALDIGSGSTKILIAQVNTCLQLIHEVYFKDSQSIKVKESLTSSQEIPENILKQLENTIATWKKNHSHLNIKTYKGAATAVFRHAKNGSDIIHKLSQRLKISIHIIDQNKEAQLGFLSAVAQSPYKIQDIIVWDIGGGSMQLTSYLGQGEFLYHKGQTASVSFKDLVLKLKPTSENTTSPNPLGDKVAVLATNEAKKIGLNTLEDDFKNAVRTKKVIGIGGVLAKSVFRQINETLKTKTLQAYLPGMNPQEDDDLPFFTDTEIDRTLKLKASWNDKQIGGDYPETDVTNLALVSGFMKALNLKKVYVVNTDLTYGLIL